VMPLIETPALWLPSYGQGFARCQAEAANPGLREGLVFNWHGPLGVTGATAFDTSGRGNDGTLTNMDPASDWVMTEKGWALDFDAVGDRIEIPSAFDISRPISVSMRVNIRTLPGGAYDYVIVNPSSATNKWGIIVPYSSFAVGVTDNATSLKYVTGNNIVPGKWYSLVALIKDPVTSSLIFLDGIQQSTSNGFTYFGNSNSNTVIGARSTGGNAMDMQVANASIWSRLLTFNEIQLLHRDQHAIVRPMMRVPVSMPRHPYYYNMISRQMQGVA